VDNQRAEIVADLQDDELGMPTGGVVLVGHGYVDVGEDGVSKPSSGGPR
jgi:hypothetical protein